MITRHYRITDTPVRCYEPADGVYEEVSEYLPITSQAYLGYVAENLVYPIQVDLGQWEPAPDNWRDLVIEELT